MLATQTQAAEISAQDQPVRPLAPGEKAAVIVRLLLSEGLSPALDQLSHDQQQRLAHRMTGLTHIDRKTLAAVVREFTGALDNLALTFPSGLPGTIDLLDPLISPEARQGLRDAAEATGNADPWARLVAMETDALAPLLSSESAEICAVLLSKLSVGKAAELLSDIPADRAEVVAHAVSLTGAISPDTVERIGATLVAQMKDKPKPAFKTNAVSRIGAILNSSTGSLRDAILEGLAARDADFADDVRRAIFTFDHIPRRVEPTDVPKIIREVEADTLITALSMGLQAAPLSVEFLLENMSKRMADQLREDAESRNLPRPAEGEAAMGQVVGVIRTLEEAGEITLIAQEE